MPDQPLLRARSIAEGHLYLRATPCPACAEGRLQTREVTVEEQHIDAVVRFSCACGRCAVQHTLRFKMDTAGLERPAGDVPGAGDAPSQIIDLAQWMTLAHDFMSQAAAAHDRADGHQLARQAAMCLDEALKFFEPDNDLPPAAAFFDDTRRQHALTYPNTFSRQTVLALRRKLPALAGSAAPPKSRRWWQLWK